MSTRGFLLPKGTVLVIDWEKAHLSDSVSLNVIEVSSAALTLNKGPGEARRLHS